MNSVSVIFRSLIVALVFLILSVAVFAPRFYLWDPTGSPYFAESNRAYYEFIQLMHPFVKIPDPGNQFLEWRLLFPVLGHLLRLHWILFFALPHLFCLILLTYVCHLVYTRTSNWLMAISATALAATCSSFFVSFGFLGYFDSALMLCILIAAFSRNTLALWAAASLGPWIDDRFIFALPVIAWCQWVQSGKLSKSWWLALGVTPYLILRLYAICINGDFSQGYLMTDILRFSHTPERLLEGFWDGLRWGWILVLAAIAAAPGLKRTTAITVIPMALTSVILSAGDYSRSMAIALPMAMLGLLLIRDKFPKQTIVALILLALLQFVTPAHHSFRGFRHQLYPITIQLKIFKYLQT